jgi:FPC/CPF motif-containing protein YcgG
MPTSGVQLLTHAGASAQTEVWRLAAMDDLAQRLAHPEFPCIFARNAHRKHLIRFIFVDALDDHHLRELATALAAYVDECREWDGRVNTANPLVVFFSEKAVSAKSVPEFHDQGWGVLRRLHQLDPAPWPDGVATATSHPGWSMCFAGMPLFVNMSTPAHLYRHSRNLGGSFAFVVNPRERFDALAGDTPRGRKTRATIRSRVDVFDDIARSPALGTYGSGAMEWPQYVLGDDNTAVSEPCPFAAAADSVPSTTPHRSTTTEGPPT